MNSRLKNEGYTALNPCKCVVRELSWIKPTMGQCRILSAVFRAIAPLILAFLAFSGQAASWYVRPGGAGGNTGADWNNAWDVGSIRWGSVAPGDTVWLAGGTYNSTLTFGASGTSGNQITVMRVRSTNAVPTSAAGWNNSFDAQVVLPPSISLNGYSYITIDGQIDQGIYCDLTSVGYGIIFGNSSRPSETGQQIKHVSLRNGNAYSTTSYGMTDSVGGSYKGANKLISHCFFNGVIVPINVNNATAWTIEYTSFLNTTNAGATSGANHCDICYVWNCNGLIIRYNQVNCEYSQAIVFYGWGNYYGVNIYGNVFDNGTCGLGGDFIAYYPANAQGNNYGPLEIYNNTFVGWPNSVDTGSSAYPRISTGQSHFYNNIFWNTSPNFYPSQSGADITHANNAYNRGIPSGEVNGVALSSAPFVGGDPGYGGAYGFDYHLTSAAAAVLGSGIALTNDGYINVDLNGNTRGADGRWEIGAYEYSTGLATNAVIQVMPTSFNFGSVPKGVAVTNSFTVQNIGGGSLPLSGIAKVPDPYTNFLQIISGATYSLAPGQSQVVKVRYTPSTNSTDTGYITCTGGYGAQVNVTGNLVAVLPGLSFPSYAGIITAPFSTNGGYVSQSVDESNLGQAGVSAGGQAVYTFNVSTAGQYTVSALVVAPSSSSKAFWVNMDAQPTDPTMIWDIYPFTTNFVSRTVSWRGTGSYTNDQYSPQIFNLTSGVHQLVIVGRDANVQLGQVTISPYSSNKPSAPQNLHVLATTGP